MSYTEKAGSSALVDTIKMIDGFRVPVFEELDYWWQEKQAECNRLTEKNVQDCIDTMYQKHSIFGCSVGFKWRMWGNPRKVGDIFKKHDCIVFSLTRNEAFEYISSLYISHVILKDFNSAQFKLVEANKKDDKEVIRAAYRSTSYDVDREVFFNLFEAKIRDELERLKFLSELKKSGVEVKAVFYEDFAYKRYSFLRAFLTIMGSASLDHYPIPAIEKVSSPFPSTLFKNRTDLLASPRLIRLLDRWNNEIVHYGFPHMIV